MTGWDSLWGLLVVITVRKCGREVRRFHGPERDVRRDAARPNTEDTPSSWEPVARDPTPAEAAMLAETLEEFMRGLKERERQILELRLQGYTVPEISTTVGRTEYTVEGVLKQVRKRLKSLRDNAGNKS